MQTQQKTDNQALPEYLVNAFKSHLNGFFEHPLPVLLFAIITIGILLCARTLSSNT